MCNNSKVIITWYNNLYLLLRCVRLGNWLVQRWSDGAEQVGSGNDSPPIPRTAREHAAWIVSCNTTPAVQLHHAPIGTTYTTQSIAACWSGAIESTRNISWFLEMCIRRVERKRKFGTSGNRIKFHCNGKYATHSFQKYRSWKTTINRDISLRSCLSKRLKSTSVGGMSWKQPTND